MELVQEPDLPNGGLHALGLDIGTSGAKAVLLGPDGEIAAEGEAGYPLSAPSPGVSEQAPEDWWRGAVEAVRSARAAADPGVRVGSIGITGQMHGTVLVDAELVPLRPALLWNDGRAGREVEELIESRGREELIELAGTLPMSGFTGPQLRMLARGGETAEARWVMCAKDFVRARLTGEVATDPSDASGTGLLAQDGGWSEELSDLYGVDPEILPPIVPSAERAGTLTPQAAAALELEAGIPVAAGAADNAAAALGNGVVEPGEMQISIGTSGTVLVPVKRPLADRSGRCHLFRHAVEGTWYAMAVALNTGGALAWWSASCGRGAAELAAAASNAPIGSDGLLMLPFLAGRRMPVADPDARGAFVGLSLAHGAGHMARAVVEGATFELADGVACLRDLGCEETAVVLTGGGGRHRIWRQALSLALPELRLSRSDPEGGAALGAALLGRSAATGESLLELTKAGITRVDLPIESPTPEELATIADAYERYRELASLLTQPRTEGNRT